MLRPAALLDRRARPRRNLAINPSFETSTATGWTSVGATYGRVTSWSISGAASARVQATGATDSAGDIRLLGGGSTSFPAGLGPGHVYRASAWIYTPAAHTTFVTADTSRQRRILLFLSVNGAAFTTVFGPQAPNTPGVHRVVGTITAPPDATGMHVGVGCAGSATDPSFVTFVDAVLIEQDPPGNLPPALDGSMANARWDTTPHASLSYGFAFAGYPGA